MTKFKKHEGKLFLMLDKPVPLTPDAKFPCVVRLIQDDSPMGRMNRHYKPDTELEKYAIVSRLSDSKLSIIGDRWNGYDIFNHEIIGYPVADGSKEWALYQMVNGEKICHKEYPSIMYCESDYGIMRKEMRYNYVECYMSVPAWLNRVYETGWQIYTKPKEEPPKEPDYVICKRCGGTGYEIKEPCDTPNPESATQTSLPVSDATQLKVGDWVEWCGDQYMVESAPPQSGGRYNIRSPYDELGCSVCPENITRKLSPSEVVIHIGCLSGTVEKAYGEKKGTFILSGLSGQRNVLWLSMLDTETRELVEGLLNAQEEE